MRDAYGKQQGMTLIEVLISMVIIAVGLLGIASLQSKAQQAEFESYQRAQALVLVQDMVNRIQANRAFDACYRLEDMNISYVGTGDLAALGCDVQADRDLLAWDDALSGAAETLDDGATNVGAMLKARGCITYDAVNQVYTVTVTWQGMSKTAGNAAANACAADQYGDIKQRRLVSASFGIAHLGL